MRRWPGDPTRIATPRADHLDAVVGGNRHATSPARPKPGGEWDAWYALPRKSRHRLIGSRFCAAGGLQPDVLALLIEAETGQDWRHCLAWFYREALASIREERASRDRRSHDQLARRHQFPTYYLYRTHLVRQLGYPSLYAYRKAMGWDGHDRQPELPALAPSKYQRKAKPCPADPGSRCPPPNSSRCATGPNDTGPQRTADASSSAPLAAPPATPLARPRSARGSTDTSSTSPPRAAALWPRARSATAQLSPPTPTGASPARPWRCEGLALAGPPCGPPIIRNTYAL